MRKKIKIIELQGGLGNQMFQYALYKRLVMEGYEAYIDDVQLIRKGNEHNGLELNRVFGCQYNHMNNLQRILLIWWKICDKITSSFGVANKGTNVLYDAEPTSWKTISDSTSKYLRGYWQEESFFAVLRDDILKDFQFVCKDLDKKNKEMVDRISACNSVAVHIRRGDYLAEKNISQRGSICTIYYYRKAINYFKEMYPDISFFFFSDDMDWVKQKFQDIKFVPVDYNSGMNSYLDMYLMSICKHNIIANSSFSWWAAWLNRNKDKCIICPKRWMNGSDFNPCLDEWIRIESE